MSSVQQQQPAAAYQQQGQPPSGPPLQFQPQQQQPVVFMQQPAVNPGTVAYYPGVQPGVPQVIVGAQVIQYTPPKYEYTPQDFWMLTILTIVFCGIFSPFSLMFSIPALLFSRKSRASFKEGSIKAARSQGTVAAYLNIAAILFALITAIVLTGLVIGVYGKTYAFNRCLESVEESYGPLPEFNDPNFNNYGSYSYSRRRYYYCR